MSYFIFQDIFRELLNYFLWIYNNIFLFKLHWKTGENSLLITKYLIYQFMFDLSSEFFGKLNSKDKTITFYYFHPSKILETRHCMFDLDHQTSVLFVFSRNKRNVLMDRTAWNDARQKRKLTKEKEYNSKKVYKDGNGSCLRNCNLRF